MMILSQQGNKNFSKKLLWSENMFGFIEGYSENEPYIIAQHVGQKLAPDLQTEQQCVMNAVCVLG